MANEASNGVLGVSVVTPEGAAFDGPADVVVVPAWDGEVAFLRGHAPFLGQLGRGELRIQRPDEGEDVWYLEGGIVQVHHDEVTVLAEHVTEVAHLDAQAARRELDEALATVPVTEDAFGVRDRTLLSARARLRVVAKRGLKKHLPD